MISIGFTGDFCPWRRVEDELSKGNMESMFNTVQPFFHENDLNILDLECPLTTSKAKINKTGPHIKAKPTTVGVLKYLNCEIVATANNHFKDFDYEGMQQTYQVLKENKIRWLGSGNSFKEASETLYWKLNDVKFAFINITENEWTTTHNNEAGCNPIDLINVYNKINEAKKNVDFIIIIAHGGHENYELPSPRIKKWYRFFIDAGANSVIGHHTHIVSGYETYKGAPIFYSLGNFCFDWDNKRNQPWNKGMLVKLKFEKNKQILFEIEFIEQNNDKVGVFLSNEKEKKEYLQDLKRINEIIQDDELLEENFSHFIKDWKPIINTWIQPYQGNILPRLYKRGVLPSIISKKKKLLYTNLIRCESHRDVLINVLNSKK
jgi:poly-gamma-glutamate synthesis protein (capsule biosynthesis protein)